MGLQISSQLEYTLTRIVPIRYHFITIQLYRRTTDSIQKQQPNKTSTTRLLVVLLSSSAFNIFNSHLSFEIFPTLYIYNYIFMNWLHLVRYFAFPCSHMLSLLLSVIHLFLFSDSIISMCAYTYLLPSSFIFMIMMHITLPSLFCWWLQCFHFNIQ